MPSNKGTKWKSCGAKNINDIHDHYKATTAKPVDKTTFTMVLESINKEFMRLIIEEGKELKMPYLNTLCVRKYKTIKPKGFDYEYYNKTGEKREFDNEHSDGYKARFHWRKKRCRISGRSAYSLDITRDNSRELSKQMKQFNGHAKYMEYNGRY